MFSIVDSREKGGSREEWKNIGKKIGRNDVPRSRSSVSYLDRGCWEKLKSRKAAGRIETEGGMVGWSLAR